MNEAKNYLIIWWLMALIFLFLWYRNDQYDRIMSVFVLTIGIINLIQYAIYSGANPEQSGKAIFITLWLQCLLLALGAFIYFQSQKKHTENWQGNIKFLEYISGANLIIFSVVFICALMYALLGTPGKTIIDEKGTLRWGQEDNQGILGNWWIIYFIGLFLPIFLLFAYYEFSDIGLAVILIYLTFTGAYIMKNYDNTQRGSVWGFLLVGVALITWFSGMLRELPKNDSQNKESTFKVNINENINIRA